MIEKNLAVSGLGQHSCLNFGGKPGTGIATKVGYCGTQEVAGKAVRRGRWTPKPEMMSLNL
jgi:hypothetical protein